MAGKSLKELLEDLTHVGELARLLSVFAELGTTECSRRELMEIASRTAGADHRAPNPEPAIAISLQLGLLKKKGDVFQLTQIARSFLADPHGKILDLTPAQGKILLGLFVDDPEIQESVALLLRNFTQNEDGRLQARVDTVGKNTLLASAANLLQQLGAIEYIGETFVFNSQFESAIPDQTTAFAALTEEALWQRLEGQRERARKIEELVLEQERSRLKTLGKLELAEAVLRVSAVDVRMGYDIKSFDGDETPRYIEVKSSTGNQIRFNWSLGERAQAEKLGDQYWIYFVPMSHMLPAAYCPVLMIRDPFSLLGKGKLEEFPSEYMVLSRKRTMASKVGQFSKDSPMVEWAPE